MHLLDYMQLKTSLAFVIAYSYFLDHYITCNLKDIASPFHV